MDPLIDFDRELSRALQVGPSGDFTARVRARIATEPTASRWSVPTLTLAVGAAISIVMVALHLSSSPSRHIAPSLPHQDLVLFTPLSAAAMSEPPMRRHESDAPVVLVAPAEMLALQRLFAGEFVAPPEAAAAEDLSIDEVAIAPIVVLTIEGEQR